MYEAIRTKEITGMNFKSHAVSNTILLGRLSKEGELVNKVGIVEKTSKNFERA